MPDTPFNPCAECVAQAGYSRMLLNADPGDCSTAWTSAKRMRFNSENLRKYRRMVVPQEITGDLGVYGNLIREGQSFIYGPINFIISPGDMDVLLPYLIGDLDSGSGGTGYYLPDTCLNEFCLLIKRDYGVFRYKGCRIAKWQLSGRALQFREESEEDKLILTAFVLAEDRDIDQVSWPSPDPGLTIDDSMAAYFFEYTTFTFQSVGRAVKDFKLTVDHNLVPRYRNSVTPTSICSYGRDVVMNMSLDWNTTNDDLIEQAAAATAKLRLTGLSSRYTEFEFALAVAEDVDPVAPGKKMDVDWSVKSIMGIDDASANEWDIKAINDSTGA